MYRRFSIAAIVLCWLSANSLTAASLFFTTGTPDGKIATVSRPTGGQLSEAETADDFILGQAAMITNATFIGLLPSGASLASVNDVAIELYHIFPLDSTFPPDGRVLTRVNSPSDNAFASFDAGLGSLSFSASILSSSFTVANSVVNGINPIPNQFTGGDGTVTGEEVQFNITFLTPFLVGAADHDFFRPEVGLTSGSFLWLSSPKPVVAPGTLQFPGGSATDLQSWIRNAALSPDWERIGTDVTGQGPFNASFSLSGTIPAVPEPSSIVLGGAGMGALMLLLRRRRSLGRG